MHVIGDSPDPKDAWTLATRRGYDRSHFYVRSTDGHGHGEMIHVKVSPALKSQIDQAIADGALSMYSSINELVRDALVHRLRDIREMTKDGTLERIYTGEMELARVEMWRKTMQGRDISVTGMIQGMSEMERMGDMPTLYATVVGARELAESMMDSKHGPDLLRAVEVYEGRYPQLRHPSMQSAVNAGANLADRIDDNRRKVQDAIDRSDAQIFNMSDWATGTD